MNKITVNYNGVGYTSLIIGTITSHTEVVCELTFKDVNSNKNKRTNQYNRDWDGA